MAPGKYWNDVIHQPQECVTLRPWGGWIVQTRVLCPQWGWVGVLLPRSSTQDREQVLSAGEGSHRIVFIQEKVQRLPVRGGRSCRGRVRLCPCPCRAGLSSQWGGWSEGPRSECKLGGGEGSQGVEAARMCRTRQLTAVVVRTAGSGVGASHPPCRAGSFSVVSGYFLVFLELEITQMAPAVLCPDSSSMQYLWWTEKGALQR